MSAPRKKDPATNTSRILPAVVLLSCFLHSCILKHGCGPERGGTDLKKLVPASALAVLEIDVKRLRGTRTGKKIFSSHVGKDDCLAPFLSKKIDSIVVSYGAGKAAPTALISCRGCDMEEVKACAARDFGVRFGEAGGGFSRAGTRFLAAAGTEPVLYLGEPVDSVLLVGTGEGVKEAADAAGGERPSLSGSGRLEELERNLEGDPQARLLVLRGGELLEGAFAGEGGPPAYLRGLERAASGLEVKGEKIFLKGRLFFGKHAAGTPQQTAGRIRGALAGLSSNPVVGRIGLAAHIEKVKVEPGEDHVGVSFSTTRSELFDFLETGKDFMSLGL